MKMTGKAVFYLGAEVSNYWIIAKGDWYGILVLWANCAYWENPMLYPSIKQAERAARELLLIQ